MLLETLPGAREVSNCCLITRVFHSQAQILHHDHFYVYSYVFNSDENRCDGCFARAATSYCINCDRILCPTCDSASHALKADADHRRCAVLLLVTPFCVRVCTHITHYARTRRHMYVDTPHTWTRTRSNAYVRHCATCSASHLLKVDADHRRCTALEGS